MIGRCPRAVNSRSRIAWTTWKPSSSGMWDVQEQQVKTPLFRQRKHLTAVTRHLGAMSLPDECLLQDLRA